MLKKSDRVNEESSNEVITEKNDSVKSVEKAINSRQSLPNWAKYSLRVSLTILNAKFSG